MKFFRKFSKQSRMLKRHLECSQLMILADPNGILAGFHDHHHRLKMRISPPSGEPCKVLCKTKPLTATMSEPMNRW